MKPDETEANIDKKIINVHKKELCPVTQHDMSTHSGSVTVFRCCINLCIKLY